MKKSIFVVSIIIIMAFCWSCAPKSNNGTKPTTPPTANPTTPPAASPTMMPDNNSADEKPDAMEQYDIYTANENDATVSVIDMKTMQATGNISVGKDPHNVQATPDKKYVYVVESGNNSISAIDTATNKIVNTISMGDIR